jgi:glycosyltransferase involved in cell wall biosynthesis
MIFNKTEKDLVAIPLYNEEATISSVIAEIRVHYSGDILIINDGSTDTSIKILKTINDPKITIINHENNQGYGKSLIDAFDYALVNNYTQLVTIDCDWQHEPKQIPEFFKELKNIDIVSGSRYYFDQKNTHSASGDTAAPNDRYRINRTVTEIINSNTNYKITDSFCGFKGYRVCGLKKLKLTEHGYAMPLQFWIQACFAGLKVKEMPVKRIYNNLNRTFGSIMDDPEKRLAYYLKIIETELNKNEHKSNAHCCASR